MTQKKQQNKKLSETSISYNQIASNDKTFLDILADDAKAKQPIDLLVRQSIEETTTESIVEHIPETPDQELDGKFVSKNVFNLSHQALTSDKFSVLDKRLNFVPTPWKLDFLPIKNDLERLGRDIKLKMYFKDNPTPAFSERLQ